MAAIDFYINTGSDFNLDLSGSGLGFYGNGGFGASVAVGEWQGRTYVTDGNGAVQGPEANNIKYLNAGSGILGQTGTGIGLKAIPNYQSTLNIRFTNSTAVKVQNVEARIYDRTSINNAASGVTTKMAEIIHPSPVQGPTGSGDSQWIEPAGSGTVLTLAQSPGSSGQFAGGGSESEYNDTRHDWYVAISASPDRIGSKTKYGLYAALEYL